MVSVGIDLGGTGIKAALVDDQGRIIRKKTIPTGAERPWQPIMEDMTGLVSDLAKEEGLEARELAGVGIGVPGTVDPERGELIYACNLPGCRHMPLREEMKKALGLPLYLDNDANVAALGESLYGAGGGQTRCSVMITLGTGVGGGVIIDGRIFAGAYHGGTELGHLVMRAGGDAGKPIVRRRPSYETPAARRKLRRILFYGSYAAGTCKDWTERWWGRPRTRETRWQAW